MAEPSENVIPPRNTKDKSKTEFLNRVKKVKSEIKTKFQKARKELDDQELNTLKRVEDIEQEILENYELTAISLKEINQAKEHALATLKSNATNILLEKNLEMFDKEIEGIKQYSKIDSSIELVWKMEKLEISSDVCEVTLNTNNSNAPTYNSLQKLDALQFLSNPISDRNAGNYQPKSEYPDFRGTSEKSDTSEKSSFEGMKQYENKRDENLRNRDTQLLYHEPPPNLQHSSKASGLFDSEIPKVPKPGEPGSMDGAASFLQHEKLGIYSLSPRDSPSWSSGQNQARTAQELPPIDEGNKEGNYIQPPQTPVGPQRVINLGKMKGKPRIPPPTKIDDKFQASAFTQSATRGLYEPQPSLPPRFRRHPDPYYENTLGRSIDNLSDSQQNPPESPGPKAEEYLPPPTYGLRMPYNPIHNMGDQQPLMSQSNHGDMGPRSVTLNDPHFYERGEVEPSHSHLQQSHMKQLLPNRPGMDQYEPRQQYNGSQDSQMFQNQETAAYQQNISPSQHNAPIPFENPHQMPRPRFPQPGNLDNYSSYVTPRPQDTHDIRMQH